MADLVTFIFAFELVLPIAVSRIFCRVGAGDQLDHDRHVNFEQYLARDAGPRDGFAYGGGD